jgi:hypothetical protein
VALHQQVQETLSALQQNDYVRFYKGVHFNGDEKHITPVLTLDFIAKQAEVWKNQNWSIPQVKLYITDYDGLSFCSIATVRSL